MLYRKSVKQGVTLAKYKLLKREGLVQHPESIKNNQIVHFNENEKLVETLECDKETLWIILRTKYNPSLVAFSF